MSDFWLCPCEVADWLEVDSLIKGSAGRHDGGGAGLLSLLSNSECVDTKHVVPPSLAQPWPSLVRRY